MLKKANLHGKVGTVQILVGVTEWECFGQIIAIFEFKRSGAFLILSLFVWSDVCLDNTH